VTDAASCPCSDADLVKFVEQRKEMNLLVGEWKKSELLRETVEQESKQLKKALRCVSSFSSCSSLSIARG